MGQRVFAAMAVPCLIAAHALVYSATPQFDKCPGYKSNVSGECDGGCGPIKWGLFKEGETEPVNSWTGSPSILTWDRCWGLGNCTLKCSCNDWQTAGNTVATYTLHGMTMTITWDEGPTVTRDPGGNYSVNDWFDLWGSAKITATASRTSEDCPWEDVTLTYRWAHEVWDPDYSTSGPYEAWDDDDTIILTLAGPQEEIVLDKDEGESRQTARTYTYDSVPEGYELEPPPSDDEGAVRFSVWLNWESQNWKDCADNEEMRQSENTEVFEVLE